jgi:CRISPR/Cas system CSM-associated protein Csm3 (group 7 of RAMP superfamily)
MSTPTEFRRRVRLSGEIEARTGLHVGAGDGATGRAVMRDGLGRPFIPGSTIRGAVRALIAGLLAAADDREAGLWVAAPDAPADVACPLRHLFGGPGAFARVRVGDALLVGESAVVERREGLAHDAASGTALPDGGFGYEVVSPGARFTFEVFADDLDDAALGLLLLGFDQLDAGFSSLGGLAARGLGRVGVRWTRLMDFEPRELLYNGGRVPETAEAPFRVRREHWRDALTEQAGG